MGEHLAELIVGNLADVGGAPAERRDDSMPGPITA